MRGMPSLRVLVLEDAENDFELLVRELTRGGYELGVRSFIDELPKQLLEKPFDPVALRATISERVANVGERGTAGSRTRLTPARKSRGQA